MKTINEICFWLFISGLLAPFMAFLFKRTSFSWHLHYYEFNSLKFGRRKIVHDGFSSNNVYWIYFCKCGSYKIIALGNELYGKNPDLPKMTKKEIKDFIEKTLYEVFGESSCG
jgi:hypothetical protein